jgi:hypothetical protein
MTDPAFVFLDPSRKEPIFPDKDADIFRCLRISTQHMPDPDEDLEDWSFGNLHAFGLQWFFAYEEQYILCNDKADKPIPDWLFNICIAAREMYDCEFILLDPSTAPLDIFPTYDH